MIIGHTNNTRFILPFCVAKNHFILLICDRFIKNIFSKSRLSIFLFWKCLHYVNVIVNYRINISRNFCEKLLLQDRPREDAWKINLGATSGQLFVVRQMSGDVHFVDALMGGYQLQDGLRRPSRDCYLSTSVWGLRVLP